MLLDSWPNFEFPLYLLENSYSNIIFCVCVFFRLHKELWDNQPNELNDGPACRCSLKARQIGIRHGIYEGEKEIPKVNLDMNSNNADKLYHYRVTISPPTNFLVKKPTVIPYDEHEFVFEGMVK